MTAYDLQAIQLEVPRSTAFTYLADDRNLPEWTNAFASVAPARPAVSVAKADPETPMTTGASHSHPGASPSASTLTPRLAHAVMRTPSGEVPVTLETHADEHRGTVDTRMIFPDGSDGWAYSRVVPLGADRCLYEFVLTPPPVPLEELEGTLAEQSKILAEELRSLKRILEKGRARG